MKASILAVSMAFLIAIVAADEPMVIGTVPGLNLEAVAAAQQEDSQTTPPGGWGDWGLTGENELTGEPTGEPTEFGTVPGLNLGAVISAKGNANPAPSSSPSNVDYTGGSVTSLPQSSCIDTCDYPFSIYKNGQKSRYASISQYSHLNLITNLSTTGAGLGEIVEFYPTTSKQGTYVRTQYNFNPGGNSIPYSGNVVGRHYLFFTLNDHTSNVVIIDVVGSGSSETLGTPPSVTPIQLPGPTQSG